MQVRGARCLAPGYPIITCPFYYFPSGFTYLSNALLTEHTILQLATFQGGRVCQLAKLVTAPAK